MTIGELTGFTLWLVASLYRPLHIYSNKADVATGTQTCSVHMVVGSAQITRTP